MKTTEEARDEFHGEALRDEWRIGWTENGDVGVWIGEGDQAFETGDTVTEAIDNAARKVLGRPLPALSAPSEERPEPVVIVERGALEAAIKEGSAPGYIYGPSSGGFQQGKRGSSIFVPLFTRPPSQELGQSPTILEVEFDLDERTVDVKRTPLPNTAMEPEQ